MTDPLYTKIKEGLEALGDGDKFEACANSLLREKYSFLTWIKGGNDAGFDGAGVQSDGTRVQLICTTQEDVIGNVTNSLNRAREENQKNDVVLVVTSRGLSPLQKRNIEKRIDDFGKGFLPIEDQPAFAELIYHSPRWRTELLGIPGHPPPLSMYPVSDRVFLPLPPIGRDGELGRLKTADTDLVVFGQPGTGKTHLLAHAAKLVDGLFLVSENAEAIADGIRSQQPKWIFVDDAKSHLPMLRMLRQIRQDTGAVFNIVAACWPGEQDEVGAALGTTGKELLGLGQLPQLDIKNIIHAAGVAGPDDLLNELIGQANGKPGLAVTLARLSFRETIRDVFTGKALARDVKRSLTEMAGKEAVGLLGFFALAGDAGLKLPDAAKIAGGRLDVVRQQAVAMGAAGVLQVLDNESLTVEPVRLRQALVAEVFCMPGFSLDWEALLPSMPKTAATLVTLIGAKAVGGKVNDASLRKHIEALGAAEPCIYYVQLGRAQSLWVLERFPGLLQEIADHVLEFAPQEALPLLIRADMETQDGDRNQQRLKSVEKWFNAVALKPETVKRRELVLNVLREMEAEVKDTPTLLAALVHVFSLRFEWISHPPGDRFKVVFQFGPVRLEAVSDIAALWPKALPFLTNLSTKQTVSLTSVLEDWVFPSARISSTLSEGYSESCKGFARDMLLDLVNAYSGRWAVLRRFDHIAEELGVELPSEGQPLVAILFPGRLSHFEIAERDEHKEAALELAQRWLKEDLISKNVSDWLACEREAREHGVGHRELSGIVAQEIASKAADVRPWLLEMSAQRAPASLIWPFVWHACRQAGSALSEFVSQYRDDDEYGGLATECLLLFSRPGAPIWDNSCRVFPQHAGRVGAAVLCNHLEDETILWLLQNGGPAVAREVASSVWSAEPKGQIPELLQAVWRQAVIDHLAEDHEWEGIAYKHPELSCAWLKRRINQTYEERHRADSDFSANHYLPFIISSLKKDHRRELIDHFAKDNWQADLVTGFVGGDLNLMRHALARPATAKLARNCLGSPEDSPNGWPERAIVLFEHGLTAREVLDASLPGSIGGWGKFSDHYEKRRQAYAAFADHGDLRVREVSALADALMTECRDNAQKRERQAAVRGDIF